MRTFIFATIAVLAFGTVPAFADHANDETHEGDDGGTQESGSTQSQDQTQEQDQLQVQQGSIDGNFSGNTTVVNPNLDSRDFKNHAETAARVEGSESGCHSGVSGQGGVFGGSIGGASASCDAINAIRAIHLAESQGEHTIANVTRANAIVRNGMRVVLSFVTLGLL